MSTADDELRDRARSHIESLLSELYWPEGVQIWMKAEQRQLGGRRAVDLITEGRSNEVLAVVNRLIDGAPRERPC